MNPIRIVQLGVLATATVYFAVAPGYQKAEAAVLHNGWNYALDSFNDGVSGTQVGGGAFEFYSLAVKATASQVFVALNSNLPIEGFANSEVTGGSVSYGDLFFNFSGLTFQAANATNRLFAVRFAASNDSNAPTLGLYSDVTAKSVTQTNSGFSNLNDFNSYVRSAGGTPSLGDLAADDSYFEQGGFGTVLNVIASGTKVGDINLLDVATLGNHGLDFTYLGAGGSQTIGFSFDRSLLPSGSYLAHLFAECANDGIVLSGELEVEAVPEPSSILGTLTAFGILSTGIKRKRQQS